MIVEFLEGRDFMTAWVAQTTPRRLTALGRDGREMTISQNRILSSQEAPDPGGKAGRLELLRLTDARRRAMALTIDLAELWEVLEGEGRDFGYAALAALFFGRAPSTDEIAAMSRAVFADGLRFKFTPEGAVRHDAAEMEKLAAARRRAEEEERFTAEAAAWIAEAARGAVAPEPAEGADEVRRLLTGLALWGEEAEGRQAAKKILGRAGLPADSEGAVRALTALGEFAAHENLDLRRLDIPVVFSPETMEAAQALPGTRRPGADGRMDLTALATLTIDSNGARDLDDAVSIKSLAGGRWQVGIHITDVAAFILPDSPLDLAARRRASSIYLPEGKYPMLPGELSEGLLSLTPGDVKPAFSFLATIEKDGAVAEYDLGPSLIRVDRQFSFSEADSLLDDDSDLVELWDLAQALVARREAAGGVNLGLPKLNVFLQPDGAVCPGLANWDTPAKTIIGEIMILANHLAAEALHKNGYPCPFRVQDKTREAPPKNVPDGPDGALALALALRRRIGRGGLSFKPGPHHGLGLSVYTAFTAPMRRYLDLLVARQLRSLAEDAPPAMDEQSFMRLGLPAYELQQRIQKMQSRRLRYWLMVWLEDKVGREFSALVFEQNGRRLRVCLTDFMLEFDIFTPRDSDGGPDLLGKRIQMKLVAARKGDEAPRFEVV